MNPEELENALAQEMANHVGEIWSGPAVSGFGAAETASVVIEFEDAIYQQPEGIGRDPRFARQSVDECDARLSIIYNSPRNAPRSVFNACYGEVKAAVMALSQSRQQLWTLVSQARDVNREAEEPVRQMIFTINVNLVAGAA